MKTVVVKENAVEIQEVEIPKIGDSDILVKMEACGICGSDLEKIYSNYGMKSRRIGHEPAGIIEKTGSKVKDFSVGDRVFVHHHVACYECHFCRSGDHTMCKQYQGSNIDPCGLSEYFLVPQWNIERGGVLRLPNDMSFEEASIVEPLACCLRALAKCNIHRDDSVAVFGVGPAGMMNILLLKHYGAGKIFALDINKFRLEFARNQGCQTINVKEQDPIIIKEETDDRGVDLAIVATGNVKAIEQALSIVRKGGKVMLFGVPPKGSEIKYDFSDLYAREITLLTSYAASEKETKAALDLIASKKIDVSPLITHKFPLSKSQEAIETAHNGDSMKVVITS